MKRWLVGSILALGTPVWAATFTVDSTADAVDAAPGDGVCATASNACTVRAAIQETNALASPDVINIPAGTYVLSIPGANEDAGATGDLDIAANSTLEIHGAGASSTIIDANGIDRVFHLAQSLAAVTLTDLTIRNGQAANGGGLAHIERQLTLLRMMVLNNHALGQGGGLDTGGSVSVIESTVADNTADYGGGIATTGVFDGLTLTNATVSGNQATGDGGGIYSYGFNATVLHNATVTNNVADSDNDGVGDGGGLADYGEARLMRNSIIAGNTDRGGEAPNIFALYPPTESRFMLTSGDPMLGPLQNNGGPTSTHALLPGSPAIDTASSLPPGSGGSACEPKDQRGVARPVGAGCDKGAVEGTGTALVCGDGVLDTGQECDDGNVTNGDGCSAGCAIEPCFVCPGEPSVCTPVSPCCGNGAIDPGEACDDGDIKSGDGCSSGCSVEPCFVCVGEPSVCTPGGPCPGCGDGVIDAGEACDDGNTMSGDGCSAACAVEFCFTCSGTPSMCTRVCGPGTLDHYKCYRAKDLKMPKFSPTVVDLSDQFISETTMVEGVKLICAPVDKAGSGINDPSTHLVCYKIKSSGLRQRVETSNQLQVSRLEVKKSKLLCVPATKTVMP